MSTRNSKRQRTSRTAHVFGAPSEADDPTAQLNAPSSASSSIRTMPIYEVPPLSTLCGRVFAGNFVKLHSTEQLWKRTTRCLQLLPDNLVSRLFRMLCSSCPTFISHEIIVTYFLRGQSISWSKELPGITKHTLRSIPRFNDGLQELHMIGFDKFSDDMFAWVVSQLPRLKVLVLRECKNVASKTVTSAAGTCNDLRIINFSYTSVPATCIGQLLMACSNLEALKVAKFIHWVDANFLKHLSSMDSGYRHPSLRTLKLRQTAVSDSSLAALLRICPNLCRLDVSFTNIRRPSSWLTPDVGGQFEKLSLTSTSVSGLELLDTLEAMPNLKKLSLGALGSAMMTDTVLQSVISTLSGRTTLESLNLVNNPKLGLIRQGDGALQSLILNIGRNCKYLNLSGITSLRSADFAGLVPQLENNNTSPALHTLILNNTGIDDDVAPFLACCQHLVTLEVGGTKLTEAGLLTIVDNCDNLKTLDLTSVRGVKVSDRRRFFEVWKETKNLS